MRFIEPAWGREDIIARDDATGAYLCKSRAQYSLVVEDPYKTWHWSRRKVTNDADALAKANKQLVAHSGPSRSRWRKQASYE